MDFLNKYTACVDQVINKTKQTNIVLKEKDRRYCLVNKTNTWHITKVKIENCIMKEIGEKGCEAILIAEQKNCKSKGYYIELKGISIGNAFKQIENSLNKTEGDLENVALFGRIIPSRYKRNKFLETKEQRLSLRFRNLGGNFLVRENYQDEI